MHQITLDTSNPATDRYEASTTFVWVHERLVEIVNEQPTDGEVPCMDVDVKLHESPDAIRSALLTAAVVNMRVARPTAAKEYDEAGRAAHWGNVIDSTNDVKALMNFARQHTFKPLHISVNDIIQFGMQHEMSEHTIWRNQWHAEQERKEVEARTSGEVTDATKITDAELWSAIANAEKRIEQERLSPQKLKWLTVSMLVLKEANARGFTYENLKATFDKEQQ